MSKIHILATAAALLVTATAPSLAAQRVHRGADTFTNDTVTTDRSGSYYYGPQGQGYREVSPFDAYASGGAVPYRSGNLPYPDRPYGDPDSW